MTEAATQLAPASNNTSTHDLVFDTDSMQRMYHMAEAMASARVTIPEHLAGSVGDCLAVIMQAMQWGMNPFAVAQKTHNVKGVLGYEAQLVNAVVSSSSLLATRIRYDYEGDWKGVNGKTSKSDDLAVTVSATLKGEDEPRALRVSMAQAGVRNSGMWTDDPRQQLAYLATKRWARLHAPDVLLGVYTKDELDVKQMGEAKRAGKAGNLEAQLAGEETKPTEPAALPHYPADEFDANFPEWKRAMRDGKYTADQLIEKAEAAGKGQLTEWQREAIRDAQPESMLDNVDRETGEVRA